MATVATTQAVTPSALPTSSSSLVPQNKSEQQKSQFLQLLVAQLKQQNPLDPKDGTEFISQLAQFSSLEELINIRTSLESIQNASAKTSGNQANPFQLTKE